MHRCADPDLRRDFGIEAVSVMLVDDHLNHCVRQAAAEGGEVADEKLSEVEKVISRLVRS